MDWRRLGAGLDKAFIRLGLFAGPDVGFGLIRFHLLSQYVTYTIALNGQTAPYLLITI
jgi:hypothetical protein